MWCDTAVVGGALGSSGEQRSGVSSSSRRALAGAADPAAGEQERETASRGVSSGTPGLGGTTTSYSGASDT